MYRQPLPYKQKLTANSTKIGLFPRHRAVSLSSPMRVHFVYYVYVCVYKLLAPGGGYWLLSHRRGCPIWPGATAQNYRISPGYAMRKQLALMIKSESCLPRLMEGATGRPDMANRWRSAIGQFMPLDYGLTRFIL